MHAAKAPRGGVRIRAEVEGVGDGIVEQEGAGSPGLIRAAETMEGRFGEIFADYERRLNEMDSLLVVGEGNARDVLERAAKVLRGAERSLLAVEEGIYRNIEDSREPLNPHPDESLRAGMALCKAAD